MKRIVGGLIILLLVLCSCGKGTLTWQEQYDLGVKYLSDGNYEEAIKSILFVLVMATSLIACGQKTSTEQEQQYDLGVRYLSEGNYEEAIIAFTAAIEIDPKRAEGYAKLADAYMEIGDREAATTIFFRGWTA